LEVDAQFHERAHVYELNGGKYLGYLDKIHFTLEPWRPSLFAITSQKIASDSLIQVLAEIK
jgi:hypothetical protein